MAILTECDLLENWRTIPKQWEAWFVEQKQYWGTINSPRYTIRVTTPGANLTMPIGKPSWSIHTVSSSASGASITS